MHPTLPLLLAALVGLAPRAPAESAPVSLFVLAGQSNMEGHGAVPAEERRNGGKGSLEALARDATAYPEIAALRTAAGTWREREDVWVHFLNRQGRLRPGFGVSDKHLGPELGFGWVVGEARPEPVLLLKVAWGGKSLGADFRPPSSGGVTGPYYTEVVQRAKAALADPGALVPELAGRSARLVGFGWHQGWNDRVNQAFNDAYETNLVNFIRDIRRDLQAPNLPFVIAETGMNGLEEKHPRALSLMRAQAAAAARPEFKGNVLFVPTRAFWRPAEASPSGQGYHWNSNAETYWRIGVGMGEAMLELLNPR
jgi:alpha-galactosidase